MREYKFNVGDVVKVVNLDGPLNSGLNSFPGDKNKLIGNCFTIRGRKNYDSDNRYLINYAGLAGWFYHEHNFEKVDFGIEDKIRHLLKEVYGCK